MTSSTRNAIKTLLRMDRTVTETERKAVVAALTVDDSAALARVAIDGAWMKSADVCLLLDIDRSTLVRWIAAKKLAAKKRGGRWYVETESVRHYMEVAK